MSSYYKRRPLAYFIITFQDLKNFEGFTRLIHTKQGDIFLASDALVWTFTFTDFA